MSAFSRLSLDERLLIRLGISQLISLKYIQEFLTSLKPICFPNPQALVDRLQCSTRKLAGSDCDCRWEWVRPISHERVHPSHYRDWIRRIPRGVSSRHNPPHECSHTIEIRPDPDVPATDLLNRCIPFSKGC